MCHNRDEITGNDISDDGGVFRDSHDEGPVYPIVNRIGRVMKMSIDR
jgi:hypothetical protein